MPEIECPGCHDGDFPDFDHYVDTENIRPEDVGTAFAAWMNLSSGWDGDAERVR